MQLNNTVNNNVLIVDNINLKLNVMTFSIYENDHLYNYAGKPLKSENINFSIDFTVNADSELSIINNLYKKCYEYILTLNTYSDYAYSDNSYGYNWVYNTDEKPVRVIINNEILLTAIKEQNALGQLIIALSPTLNEYSIKNETQVIIYLSQVLSEHQTILDGYPNDVFVDYYLPQSFEV